MTHKIILIGLGKQMIKDHYVAVKKRIDLDIVAFVDVNSNSYEQNLSDTNIPFFSNLEHTIKITNPDCAIVCVPHNQYLNILSILAKNKIATLKEKPFAVNFEEAKSLLEIFQKNKTYLQICVQRRFSNLYKIMKEKIEDIGEVYSLYAEYMLSLKSLDKSALGWRSNIDISGGGATLDLGYHTIDLVTNLFGKPDKLYAQLNFNSLDQDYTIDDSAKVMLTYNDKINANLMITKIYLKKTERIRIFGQKGYVTLDDRTVNLLNREGEILESHSFNTKNIEVDMQLDYFIKNLFHHELNIIENNPALKDQFINMEIIDSIYKSHKNNQVIIF
jgi:predicted dehydrogenase